MPPSLGDVLHAVLGLLRWMVGMHIAIPPNKHTLGITVIIPAYNEARSIKDTIISLRKQTLAPQEIIVVDDCSTDATGEEAQSAGARVICTPANTGRKVTAQNEGYRAVTTELFVVVDADTKLDSDALAKISRWFQHEKVAAVCGYVLPQNIETIWERIRLIDYLFGFTIFKNAQNHMGAILVASGCFTMFRKRAVEEIGGFPEIETLAEDMEVTWRLMENKWLVLFDETAICEAIDPPTWTIYQRQLDRWFRGLFQCLRYRHFTGIYKHWRLGAVITFMVLEPILAPFLVFGGLVYHSWGNPLEIFLLLWGFLLLESCVMALFILYSAARLHLLHVVIRSLHLIPLLRIVNPVLFWRAFIREIVLRKKLAVWQKGH
jgi:poly-beta-1,6-N-acetyl-D-glucosamine synthase